MSQSLSKLSRIPNKVVTYDLDPRSDPSFDKRLQNCRWQSNTQTSQQKQKEYHNNHYKERGCSKRMQNCNGRDTLRLTMGVMLSSSPPPPPSPQNMTNTNISAKRYFLWIISCLKCQSELFSEPRPALLDSKSFALKIPLLQKIFFISAASFFFLAFFFFFF